MDPKTFHFKSNKTKFPIDLRIIAGEMSTIGVNAFTIVQNTCNPLGTQDYQSERILRTLKAKSSNKTCKWDLESEEQGDNEDDEDILIHEFGVQPYLLMDLNQELHGLNRKPGERYTDYVKRAWKSKFVFESLDFATPEFVPKLYSCFNSKHVTSAETYYFSLTTGDSCNFAHKRTEFFTEGARTAKAGVGFDLDVIENIALSDDVTKHSRCSYLPPTAWD